MIKATQPTIQQRLALFSFWLYRLKTLQRAERLFRGASRGTILERRIFGFKFLCDVSKDNPNRLIYAEGERFIAERRLVLRCVKSGFRVVDVGANIGYYCLMFCKGVGPAGKVQAIEPSPENLSQLEGNVARNGLGNQVEITACAVGDRTETVGLREGTNSGVMDISNAAYTVKLDTLDNLVKGRVDFMKMDIEGYEIFALRGAERLLNEWRPILFVEIHPAFLRNLGSSADAVLEQLRQTYDQIDVYDPGRENSFFSKIMQRYLDIGVVRKVKDVTAYVSRASRDTHVEPFWAICRSSRS